ncbi:MAG: MFS transporter [Treponema sp.]|nr:MFS transporter [Treponema sp.]
MLNIFFLGLISFFTDLSTEMVYPLIPLYLVGAFGATHVLVGIIEGIAESLASLLKVYSGYLTDRFQKKKLLAFSGYAAGFIYKALLIFASSWLGILGAKVIDRLGKGIRTAPRDVLVSESTDAKNMGKAFGLHKALDMFGAALGIFIVFMLLREQSGDFNYKYLFALSMIPAALGLIMFIFVKEKKLLISVNNAMYSRKAETLIREPFWKNIKKIDSQLKLYLLVVFIFTLGNSSKAFMILKASDSGFNEIDVILLFMIYHIVAAALSMPLGKLSDKIGRKNLLVPGYIIFALCYFGFAIAGSKLSMITVFALYGIYTAMITGVERAFVAEIAPVELKGTMLGLHSTVAGIALLPASVIAGLLWTVFGSSVPFIFGACLSLIAALLLVIFMKKKTASQLGKTDPDLDIA